MHGCFERNKPMLLLNVTVPYLFASQNDLLLFHNRYIIFTIALIFEFWTRSKSYTVCTYWHKEGAWSGLTGQGSGLTGQARSLACQAGLTGQLAFGSPGYRHCSVAIIQWTLTNPNRLSTCTHRSVSAFRGFVTVYNWLHRQNDVLGILLLFLSIRSSIIHS